MSILRAFRSIPESLRDWERWIKQQDTAIDDAIDALGVSRGTGAPEGVVTGTRGDLYLRTDGGASTTLYVKESGDATKYGWAAK